MTPADRTRLRQLLDAFDEAGLVALSNKGLVRRAEKDLQTGGLSVEETDTALLVRGPGWIVTMPPDGPAKATDDTKASGVTRQILTATMFLRATWRPEGAPSGGETAAQPIPPPLPDTGAIEEALLGISMADLLKWGNKSLVEEALAVLSPPPVLEVETHLGLTLRLPQLEVEARLLPQSGKASPARTLDAILTTAPKATHRRWVIAAVLAFQQSRGKTVALEKRDAPEEPEGAARSRAQVLAAARELLEAMVTTGVAHPSERMAQRLLTLSVSTGAVNLPRLARLLRTIADDVSLTLDRDAQADTRRLFARMAFTHALVRALERAGDDPPAALVGQHRTLYEPVGNLELAGLGAWPWQSPTGYEGVTALFWDVGHKRFRTWSTSRPIAMPGRFSQGQVYSVEPLWNGGSVERMCRSRFTLSGARANPLGQLSASKKSDVSGPVQPTHVEDLDLSPVLFTRWELLETYARSTAGGGLSDPNPLERTVILRPAQWAERAFDELQQRFVWKLDDDDGAALLLTLPWEGVNESAIEFLEAVKPDRDKLTHVIARIAPGPGRTFEPLALLSEGTPTGLRVLNPGFDIARLSTRNTTLLERLRAKYGRDRVATTMTGDDDSDGLPGDVNGRVFPPGMESWFSELEGFLLSLAESGTRRFPDPHKIRLSQLKSLCQRVGLSVLDESLAEITTANELAPSVLWCGYLCQLHRQAVM